MLSGGWECSVSWSQCWFHECVQLWQFVQLYAYDLYTSLNDCSGGWRVKRREDQLFFSVQNTLESAHSCYVNCHQALTIACLDLYSSQSGTSRCLSLPTFSSTTALKGAFTNMNQIPPLPGWKFCSDFPLLLGLMSQILPRASEHIVIGPCHLSVLMPPALWSSHSDFHWPNIWLPQGLCNCCCRSLPGPLFP